MKKVILSVALALAVAGSWAFYPKAPAAPSGYMMVISRIEYGSKSGLLTTVFPDGQSQTATIAFSEKKTGLEDLNKAEVLKLNQLHQAGWRVISASPVVEARVTGGMSNASQTTYLLEK
ncbi:MAG TPA: hypothetical protein VF630_17965 [Hymenobacter sp.]|jgi:hypothetical protein